MKKIMGFMGLLVFLVLISAGIYFGMQQYAITGTLEPQPNTLYIPNYGFLECQELDSARNYPSSDMIKIGYRTVTCQEAGTLTQDCDVNIQLPTKQDVDKLNGYLLWQKTKQGTPMPEGSRANSWWIKKAGFTGDESGQLKSIRLNSDEVLYLNYIEENLVSAIFNTGKTVYGKVKFNIRYRPFYIFQYDSFSSTTGNYNPNTKDCTFDNNFLRANPIVEKINGNANLPSEVVNNVGSPDILREPNRVITYISGRVAIDPTSITVVDDTKICKDSNIYPIVSLETTAGIYYVADISYASIIDSVECCDDGDALSKMGAGYYCDNFKIKKKTVDSQQSCTINSDCVLSTPIRGIGKEVFYEKCVSGGCELQSVQVECTSDSDCNTGYCAYDAKNPEKSECREDKEVQYCGNGLCELSRGEDEYSCSKDCAPQENNGIPQWAVLSIIGAGILSIFMALSSRRRRELL